MANWDARGAFLPLLAVSMGAAVPECEGAVTAPPWCSRRTCVIALLLVLLLLLLYKHGPVLTDLSTSSRMWHVILTLSFTFT